MAGGFVDSYYGFLKYTMKEGLLYGMYYFLVSMGIITADIDTAHGTKIQFVSNWIFEEWGDDASYYKVSKNIWVFLFDDPAGVCDMSTAIQCTIAKYYWMFIMTLNIFLTLPLSHAAATYDTWMGRWEKLDTIMKWFA